MNFPTNQMMPTAPIILNPLQAGSEQDNSGSINTVKSHAPLDQGIPSSRPIGPPPSDVRSFVPPFELPERQPFGKLLITVERGKQLKAGQGVFGKADPYVKLKIGDKEVLTEPNIKGGKTPVSLFGCTKFDYVASSTIWGDT
jgi:hypothetical protein